MNISLLASARAKRMEIRSDKKRPRSNGVDKTVTENIVGAHSYLSPAAVIINTVVRSSQDSLFTICSHWTSLNLRTGMINNLVVPRHPEDDELFPFKLGFSSCHLSPLACSLDIYLDIRLAVKLCSSDVQYFL